MIDSPDRTIATLANFARAMRSSRLGSVFIDFGALEQYDLGANGLLDILVDELMIEARSTGRIIRWRGNFPSNPAHVRFVRAMGVIKRLKVEHEADCCLRQHLAISQGAPDPGWTLLSMASITTMNRRRARHRSTRLPTKPSLWCISRIRPVARALRSWASSRSPGGSDLSCLKRPCWPFAQALAKPSSRPAARAAAGEDTKAPCGGHTLTCTSTHQRVDRTSP